MPWTEAQVRLFRAAANNPEIAKAKGISQAKAREMAAEGVKKPRGITGGKPSVKDYAKALRK